MSDPEIKVTDRRMFTPDGRLREEFGHLDEPGAPPSGEVPGEAPGDATAVAEPVVPPPPAPGVTPAGEPETATADSGRARVEIPLPQEGLGTPTFFDLVGVLAEPVLIYLGDAQLPDGSTSENLDMARLYIDLLDLLRQKTAGRLTPQEATFMEDLLYQLRMRYVQKRG
jgi:Domain of unknown function (DUF1844)